MLRNKVLAKLISWPSIAGIFSILLGINILITGRLKHIILLDNEKYLLGAISIAFGLYLFLVIFQKKDVKSPNEK